VIPADEGAGAVWAGTEGTASQAATRMASDRNRQKGLGRVLTTTIIEG
jgi:hypothetical protein